MAYSEESKEMKTPPPPSSIAAHLTRSEEEEPPHGSAPESIFRIIGAASHMCKI